jgi:hypothetical protein
MNSSHLTFQAFEQKGHDSLVSDLELHSRVFSHVEQQVQAHVEQRILCKLVVFKLLFRSSIILDNETWEGGGRLRRKSRRTSFDIFFSL